MTIVRLAAAAALAGASLLAAAPAHAECPPNPPAVWRACTAAGDPTDIRCWREPDTGRIFCEW